MSKSTNLLYYLKNFVIYLFIFIIYLFIFIYFYKITSQAIVISKFHIFVYIENYCIISEVQYQEIYKLLNISAEDYKNLIKLINNQNVIKFEDKLHSLGIENHHLKDVLNYITLEENNIRRKRSLEDFIFLLRN